MKSKLPILVLLVALVFSIALAEVYQNVTVKRTLRLDNAGVVIYGNASIRGTATFERGALIDTVVNTKFASGDYVIAQFTNSNVTAADSSNNGPYPYVKADTIFFKRTTAKYDSSSANGDTYNYIVLK